MGVTSIEHGMAPWPYVLKDKYSIKQDSLIGTDIDLGQQMNLMAQIAELGIAGISEERLKDLAVLMIKNRSVLCPTLHVFKKGKKKKSNQVQVILQKSRKFGIQFLLG